MSVVDWAAMPGDEPGELVDGRLVEEEVPDLIHETVVSWLVFVLRTWLGSRGGFVFGSEAKFAVRPRRGRKPDVSMFLPGGPPPPRRGVLRVPPSVAIEVVSALPRDRPRDRVEKVEDYSAFGVRWYWLVDPELRTLEVLELGDDKPYAHALGASSGVVEVPGCAGLMLDLDAMWSEVDRLGAEEPSG
jgi:Uma2 family endonuclease